MSEQNLQTEKDESVSKESDLFEEFVVRINRATNEIVFTNPVTGKTTSIKAKVVEEAPPPIELQEPLTIEQFREAWHAIDELGLTWTTDIPPRLIFKKGQKPGPAFVEQYTKLEEKFPNFPRELGSVVLKTLLSRELEGTLKEKAETISNLLTQEYRAEFFFKYAIKVPYFEDIDWEVVVKAYERGTEAMPRIAYALLALTFRGPVDTTLTVEEGANQEREPEFMTVAVNETSIKKLMGRLQQIRVALEKAQRAADSLTEREVQEEQTNGTPVSA